MTRSKVEFILTKKKEKASISLVSLDLKPPYSTEVAARPYPSEYKTPKFRRYDDRKCNTWVLDSMGPFAHHVDLCLKEFSKSILTGNIPGTSI